MAQARKVIIVGSGPAGATAAIYTSRAELKPLVIAGEKSGGQLVNTALVENWPGTEKGVMGPELMIEMRKQAIKFGTEVIDKNVTAVDFSSRPFKLWVKAPLSGKTAEELLMYGTDEEFAAETVKIKQQPHDYEAEAVIVTTGAIPIMLGVPGERKLLGRGVATCAVCDAPFYKEKIVYVIGGGDAAAEDALALTKHAKEVFLVHRRDQLRASKIMAKRVEENPKIKILWNSEFKEVKGEQKVEKIKLFNNKTNQTNEYLADGVFLAIGHKPMTKIFQNQLTLDEKGYIKVSMQFPEVTKTSIEGVFAAGDVVDYKYRQAVTAAGMGCQAALDAERWLEKG